MKVFCQALWIGILSLSLMGCGQLHELYLTFKELYTGSIGSAQIEFECNATALNFVRASFKEAALKAYRKKGLHVFSAEVDQLAIEIQEERAQADAIDPYKLNRPERLALYEGERKEFQKFKELLDQRHPDYHPQCQALLKDLFKKCYGRVDSHCIKQNVKTYEKFRRSQDKIFNAFYTVSLERYQMVQRILSGDQEFFLTWIPKNVEALEDPVFQAQAILASLKAGQFESLKAIISFSEIQPFVDRLLEKKSSETPSVVDPHPQKTRLVRDYVKSFRRIFAHKELSVEQIKTYALFFASLRSREREALFDAEQLFQLAAQPDNRIQTLKEVGFSLKRKDRWDRDVMILAVRNGALETVQRLLQLGFSVEHTNRFNSTLIHQAFDKCNKEMVELLASKGANLYRKQYQKYGDNIFQRAQKEQRLDLIQGVRQRR